MKCKDCKYFDADNHPTISSFMSRAGHCDKRVADGYDEYPQPDCDACDMFEPKEERRHAMTCKDCKHFYNREPKPWRTNPDIGLCDHGKFGKIEVNRNCPVNICCNKEYEPKEDSWESVSK